MTVYVLEYLGQAWLRAGAAPFPAPAEPCLAVTVISSGGSSGAGMTTIAFSSATELVEINATAQTFFWQIGSSLMSTVSGGGSSALSSTNASVLLAGSTQYFGNVYKYRGVTPHGKLIGWSS
jgi:hypothetical protein